MPKQSKTTRSASGRPATPLSTKPLSAGLPGLEGPDLGPMAEVGQRSLAAFAELHSRSVRDAMRFNAELLDFARRRLNADIEASDRLARCTSVEQAMDAIGEFYRGAFRDYAEETTALARLGIDSGIEAGTAAGAAAGTGSATESPADTAPPGPVGRG